MLLITYLPGVAIRRRGLTFVSRRLRPVAHMALKLRSAGYNAITMSTIIGCGGSEAGVPGVISGLPRDYGDLINAPLKIISKNTQST